MFISSLGGQISDDWFEANAFVKKRISPRYAGFHIFRALSRIRLSKTDLFNLLWGIYFILLLVLF